jgi:hypothetical protein
MMALGASVVKALTEWETLIETKSRVAKMCGNLGT